MAEGTAAQGAGPGRATRRPAPGQDVPMPAAAAAGEAGPSESVPARSEASPPAHDSPCVGLNRRARTCSQQCRTSTVSFLGVSGEALEASRHPSPDLAILLTLRPHPRRPPHHSRTPLALIKIHCGNDQCIYNRRATSAPPKPRVSMCMRGSRLTRQRGKLPFVWSYNVLFLNMTSPTPPQVNARLSRCEAHD